MLPIQDNSSYLLELAFKEDATARELLTIALSFSVLWAIVFTIAKPLLRRLTYGRPWLRAACEREYDRGGGKMYEEWGMKMTKDEAIDFMMKDWAFVQVLLIQHAAGALLCVPSVFGLMEDTSMASSLAACGILSEMGWEIEHLGEMIYDYFSGTASYPLAVYCMSVFHHSLTTGLGIPMVLHYRNLKPLHWLCFDLQGSALISALTEYSKTLDITKPNDLHKFKMVNIIVLLTTVWARLVHWVYCSAQIIMTWYHDEAWTFMAVGIIPIVLFSMLNLLFVMGAYKRFMKFAKKSAGHEALPPGAPDIERRKSVADLQDAVDELLMEGSLGLEDRVQMFLESFEGRQKIEKRRTLPPSKTRRISVRHARMMKQFQSAPAVKVD